jgi:hypothetical protein
MQHNKLSITIDSTVSEVFDFTINPINTPRWIEHLLIEECSEYPPRLGTVYRNKGAAESWSEYSVSGFEPNQTFELLAKDGNYHVRYTYTEAGKGTAMEYLEWVNEGDLDLPFTQDVLEKLKRVMETENRVVK